MKVLLTIETQTFSILQRFLWKHIAMNFIKACFASCGNNVTIGKGGNFTYNHVYIENHTSVGPNAFFMSTVANNYIGDHVMFGPHILLISGDHRIDIVGRFMTDIKDHDKLPENDQDIVIEDDVWIGANVIILRGETVGRGSVVAAGSVVIWSIEHIAYMQ